MNANAPALLLCGLFVACAGADEGPVGHIRFHGSRGGTEFRVTRDGISNERVSVSRVDKTKNFRGVIDHDGEVELRPEGEAVKGDLRSAPIDLKIDKRSDSVTVVHGMVGGHLLNLHILHQGPANCAYSFDEKQEGQAESCANQYGVELPPEINQLPIDEQAALLSIAFYH